MSIACLFSLFLWSQIQEYSAKKTALQQSQPLFLRKAHNYSFLFALHQIDVVSFPDFFSLCFLLRHHSYTMYKNNGTILQHKTTSHLTNYKKL